MKRITVLSLAVVLVLLTVEVVARPSAYDQQRSRAERRANPPPTAEEYYWVNYSTYSYIQGLYSRVLKYAGRYEGNRSGPIYSRIRRTSYLLHDAPSIAFVEPDDGGEYAGFVVETNAEWLDAPEDASDYADGSAAPNSGHVRLWITDAGGVVYDGPLDELCFLAPGAYQAFAQLVNHDGTPAIPADAAAVPPVDAVRFVVSPGSAALCAD